MTSEDTLHKINILQHYFKKFASAESNRFRNLGIITKEEHHYYIDDNGKTTFNYNEIALDIYYIKASNKLIGDTVINGDRRNAVFSKEMPKSNIDRTRWLK